jgi:MraZ protein
MFAGEFHSRADAAGLFRLPPIFLAALPPPAEASGRQVVLLKSLDRSLWLYPAPSWDATLTATRERLDAEQSRLLMHYVVAESTVVELDPQGRFALPKLLRTFAAITTDVVLVGMYERIEVWSPARWDAYVAELADRHEQVLARILDLL